jgi:hypothetical protein
MALLAAQSAAVGGSILLPLVSAASVVTNLLHRESRNSSLLYQLFSCDWLLLHALRSPCNQDMMAGKLCWKSASGNNSDSCTRCSNLAQHRQHDKQSAQWDAHVSTMHVCALYMTS